MIEEVFEIQLDDKKIDELINKLHKLKENKEHEHIDDLEKNHILLIHKETEICK